MTNNEDDQGLEVRLQSFFPTLTMHLVVRDDLTTSSVSTLFFYIYKMGLRAEKKTLLYI